MQFLVSCRLEYEVNFPSTLLLSVLPQRNAGQTILDERLRVSPRIPAEEFSIDGGGTRFLRLKTGRKRKVVVDYQGTVDCDYRYFAAGSIDDVPVAEMDRTAMPFLFPSRYCQSDRLSRFAWNHFGKINGPFEQAVAVTNWIHKNVEYLRGSTNSNTSAYDTVTQRTGVCRDFAHLGIAICRALNIPSRYFTGYAYHLEPPDFHACFECYVGGRWLIFDATRLAHLNGLVRVGVGRDAADVAVASIFGRARCTEMTVDCRLKPGQVYRPLKRKPLHDQGISLEIGRVG